MIKDIEAQTGIDLKVEKKKKGRQKSKLTNINKVNVTSRSRLESKVLSRFVHPFLFVELSVRIGADNSENKLLQLLVCP